MEIMIAEKRQMLQTFTMQIQQHGKKDVVVMGMGGNTSEPLSSSSVHGSKMTTWGYVHTTAWGAELDLKQNLQSVFIPATPLHVQIQPTAGSAVL